MLELKTIVQAQREVRAGKPGPAVDELQSQLPKLRPAHRPLALYWLGRARITASEPTHVNQGLLDLLTLPAAHAESSPDLAAAGLFAAYETLVARGDSRGSIALRKELLERYGGTYHGLRLKSETTAKP